MLYKFTYLLTYLLTDLHHHRQKPVLTWYKWTSLQDNGTVRELCQWTPHEK